MSELKPCPFCGGEAETIYNDIGVFIGCFNVDCLIGPATSTYVDGYATEAEAIAAWNTRYELMCCAIQAKSLIAYTCSECGTMLANWCMNRCPNCGARVVGE